MAPSSRFALSLKLNVAYLELNFLALWKKQRTLPFLAYAGIPYQVFGERAGALALMISWSRLPMVRSGSGISAIFASTSLSPASAFSSWARSFIAARSSSVNFCVSFFALISFPPVQALPYPTPSSKSAGGSGAGASRFLIGLVTCDGGHQAAATDVARGLLHGATSHLSASRRETSPLASPLASTSKERPLSTLVIGLPPFPGRAGLVSPA